MIFFCWGEKKNLTKNTDWNWKNVGRVRIAKKPLVKDHDHQGNESVGRQRKLKVN